LSFPNRQSAHVGRPKETRDEQLAEEHLESDDAERLIDVEHASLFPQPTKEHGVIA
jgi:hypothetical protein